MAAVVNHIGLVVADLERSIRFYCAVFGFEEWYRLSPPDEGTAKLCSLPPPLGVTAVYLTLGGFVLELIHYAAPGSLAPARARRFNAPGLTHLSISVATIRASEERAVELGGTVIEDSDLGLALVIRDPDGQMLELLEESFPERRPPLPG